MATRGGWNARSSQDLPVISPVVVLGDRPLPGFVPDRRIGLDHRPPLRFCLPGAMRQIPSHDFDLVRHVASALKVLTHLRREPGEVAAGH